MKFRKLNKADFKKFVNTTRFKTTIWYTLVFLLLECMFAVSVYFYLYSNSVDRLDLALKMQAQSILRIVSEKHVDLVNFEPDANYQTPEDLITDMLYDVFVLNKRNYFIQITQNKKIYYRTKNLKKNILKTPENDKIEISRSFDIEDFAIVEGDIRCYQLVDKGMKIIVAYPKEYISQALGSLIDIYVIVAPISLVISILGGAVISSKALSRIDAIIKKTEEITAQRLNEQIPGGEYGDEYGRLVNKMNEMIERIKTSVEFMNQFSVSAAHELKTPLTILRGEIEITLKSEKTPAEYIDVLKSNYEETIRLIKIIDNLFFVSKSDNKLIAPEKTVVSAKEFLSISVNSLRLIGQEKNIELVLHIEDDADLNVDTNLMKQAILNLIDNAVKYGYESKPVIIRGKKFQDNEYTISITNEGDGIPAASLEKIFDRFYRVESSRNRKTGGVGLGLSVVKSIMLLHNGSINVTSVEFGKTTFNIILPV